MERYLYWGWWLTWKYEPDGLNPQFTAWSLALKTPCGWFGISLDGLRRRSVYWARCLDRKAFYFAELK